MSVTLGQPRYFSDSRKQFSDDEVDRMRAALAKRWRQSKDQVTDVEALYYLRTDAALHPQSKEQ